MADRIVSAYERHLAAIFDAFAVTQERYWRQVMTTKMKIERGSVRWIESI